jgi:hypothetical protein
MTDISKARFVFRQYHVEAPQEYNADQAFGWAVGRDSAIDEILSLRQQLAEAERTITERSNLITSSWEASNLDECRTNLAECQAREKVLREHFKDCKCQPMLYIPSDSTALDEAIKRAKREALLEAADVLTKLWGQSVEDTAGDLRSMAEELK